MNKKKAVIKDICLFSIDYCNFCDEGGITTTKANLVENTFLINNLLYVGINKAVKEINNVFGIKYKTKEALQINHIGGLSICIKCAGLFFKLMDKDKKA